MQASAYRWCDRTIGSDKRNDRSLTLCELRPMTNPTAAYHQRTSPALAGAFLSVQRNVLRRMGIRLDCRGYEMYVLHNWK